MTQPSRTTETINRDNAAIRDIMHQVRELTVPDRATLAVGLVGHLATMMNRSQMTRLMNQLQEEAERVQDVPPSRQVADDAADTAMDGVSLDTATDRVSRDDARSQGASADARDREAQKHARVAADGAQAAEPRKHHGDVLEDHVVERAGSRKDAAGARGDLTDSRQGVGQAGRGEFRSGRLL